MLVDGDLVIDTTAHEARRSGELLPLTTREFDLLVFFLTNPVQAFSRKQLLPEVWGWYVGDESTVTVHIRRLRAKVDRMRAPCRVVTVWGSATATSPSR